MSRTYTKITSNGKNIIVRMLKFVNELNVIIHI